MPGSLELFAAFPNKYFVETGAYKGEGIQFALNAGFEFIYSVEIEGTFYRLCQRRFAGNGKVKLIRGDSATVLWDVIKDIKQPITFWLDAHRIGAVVKDESNTALLAELEVIERHFIKIHSILIDDSRYFGTEVFDNIQTDQVLQFLFKINPKYQILYYDGYVAKDILTACIKE